jgi:hypothetical protein
MCACVHACIGELPAPSGQRQPLGVAWALHSPAFTWRHRTPAARAAEWRRSGCSACGTCWSWLGGSRQSFAAAGCCDRPLGRTGNPAIAQDTRPSRLGIFRRGQAAWADGCSRLGSYLCHQIIRLVQQRLPVLGIAPRHRRHEIELVFQARWANSSQLCGLQVLLQRSEAQDTIITIIIDSSWGEKLWRPGGGGPGP